MTNNCIFNLDAKYAKKYENDLSQVLNEVGKMLPGDNLVIGPCSIGNEVGTNVRSLEQADRSSPNIVITDNPTGIPTDEFFSSYRNLDQILLRLDHVCSNSNICERTVLNPKTVQGNNLIMYSIGNGPNKILITGGIHAREWLSVATTSYLVNKLNDLKDNDEWKDIFGENTFYIIPISNPDGYFQSYQSSISRFWRKNMNGVDLNRNWDVGFENISNTESDIYGGTEPFTENETKALKSVIDGNDFIFHLDIHAYSQIVAASWSYTEDLHPRNTEFVALGNIIKDSMKNNTYTYGHGSINGTLGLAGGTIQDYTSANGTLGFTIELPPKTGGLNSFALDSSEIIPVGNDLVNVLKNTTYKPTKEIISEFVPTTKISTKTFDNIGLYILLFLLTIMIIVIILKVIKSY